MVAHRLLASAALVALALTQQACSPTGSGTAPSPGSGDLATAPSSKAAAATAASSPEAASRARVLSGDRQVVIAVRPSSETVLALDDRGRLNGVDGDTEKDLFVFVPVGEKYRIRTAKADSDGEPSCLGRKNGTAGNPDTIVAAACDTGAPGQLFTVREHDKGDDGRVTYEITVDGDGVLQLSARAGLFAQPLGDSPLETTFALIDNGPAPRSAPGDTAEETTGVRACRQDDITSTITAQPQRTEGAQRMAMIVATNTGRDTCSVQGWLSVLLVNPAGAVLRVPTEKVAQPGDAAQIALASGRSAVAGIKWVTCDKADSICAAGNSFTIGVSGTKAAPATLADFGSPDSANITMKSLQIGTLQRDQKNVLAW